ncbi:MAG: MFS transporter [Candidatus Thorarchaeota archaeon]
MESTKPSYADRIRLLKKDARLFIASNAASSFAFGISNVIFNLYMVESGFGEDFLGFFLSISMFATAGIAIFAGMFTDRRSRKLIILASSFISFAMILVQYTTLDPIWLMMSQVFLGLSSAFSQVSWSPYITDLSTNEERAHLFGFSSGIALLSVLAGNLLGGYMPAFLMNTFGTSLTLFWAYRLTLWFSLIPMLISGLVVIPMTRDIVVTVSPGIDFKNVKSWGFIGKYASTVTTVGLGAGMIVMFFNIFFSQVFIADASLIGVIFGINTIVLAAGNFLAPAMSDRIGKVRTVVLTEALSVPFLLMISWAPVLWLAVVAYVSRTVLMNMGGPVANAFFMEYLAKEERATAVGIVRTGDSFVRGVAANIGGMLLAAGLYRLPYVLVSGLYILAIVLFYGFFRDKESLLQKLKDIEVLREEEEEVEIT